MTPHGKTNNNSHNNPLQYTRIQGAHGNTTRADAVAISGSKTDKSIPQRQKPLTSPAGCNQPQGARRSAVDDCVGVSSWANQSREGGCRQISGRTNLSAKISAARIGEFLSAISQGSHHPARPNTTLRSEPAKTRDRRAAGFAAMLPRRLPSMPSWLTSSRGSNDRAYPGHRRAI